MKHILLVIIIFAAGFFGYQKTHGNNPTEIINPVYLESRIILKVSELSRDFEYVLVAKYDQNYFLRGCLKMYNL